jgi:hypothetical protein
MLPHFSADEVSSALAPAHQEGRPGDDLRGRPRGWPVGGSPDTELLKCGTGTDERTMASKQTAEVNPSYVSSARSRTTARGSRPGYSSRMPVRFTQTGLNPNAAAPAMSHRFDETKSTSLEGTANASSTS